MPSPLVKPVIMSIYEAGGQRVLMPERMARVTPDLKRALYGIRDELKASGGKLELSDLFRSYDMQLQAHLDYTSKKKKAYSPPPGGSMHEAGRAFDLDLARIKVTLAAFWEIAKRWGVVPIIDKPSTRISECWHFECRGSHQLVRDYYAAGKGTNFKPAA
jgi:D-alanyl-D-alanine dipeptidase